VGGGKVGGGITDRGEGETVSSGEGNRRLFIKGGGGKAKKHERKPTTRQTPKGNTRHHQCETSNGVKISLVNAKRRLARKKEKAKKDREQGKETGRNVPIAVGRAPPSERDERNQKAAKRAKQHLRKRETETEGTSKPKTKTGEEEKIFWLDEGWARRGLSRETPRVAQRQ